MKAQRVSECEPLILASASARRKRLLAQLGLPFKVVVSLVDEENSASPPKELCVQLAAMKAHEVARRQGPAWVLGADTIVTINGRTLGKPQDGHEAFQMLSLLSGQVHEVMTGICLIHPEKGSVYNNFVSTKVRFIGLTERDILGYIQTGEPFGKAGGYAIQGLGAFMVESISGSYTNVVGLPVCHLIQVMLRCGALESFP